MNFECFGLIGSVNKLFRINVIRRHTRFLARADELDVALSELQSANRYCLHCDVFLASCVRAVAVARSVSVWSFEPFGSVSKLVVYHIRRHTGVLGRADELDRA